MGWIVLGFSLAAVGSLMVKIVRAVWNRTRFVVGKKL